MRQGHTIPFMYEIIHFVLTLKNDIYFVKKNLTDLFIFMTHLGCQTNFVTYPALSICKYDKKLKNWKGNNKNDVKSLDVKRVDKYQKQIVWSEHLRVIISLL